MTPKYKSPQPPNSVTPESYDLSIKEDHEFAIDLQYSSSKKTANQESNRSLEMVN